MKRKTRIIKKVAAFLSAVVLFSTACPSKSLATENAKSFEQFVTDIKITDKNGEQFSEKHPASKGMDINVEWKFNVSPEQQKEILKNQDAIYELKCPDAIYELIKDEYGKSVTEKWTTISEGTGYGVSFKYRPCADGIIQIQLIDFDQGGNISGSFKMATKLNSNITQEVKEIQVTINGKVIDIPLYIPKTSSISIEKSGYYDSNTNEIKWTIKVKPQNEQETLAGVKVTDTIDTESQTMDKITKVYCDDKPISVHFTENETKEITGFEYTFPENTSTGTKQITFSTKPKDFVFDNEDKDYVVKNHAEAEKDGITVKAYAEAYVHTDFISKDSGKEVKDANGKAVVDKDGNHFIEYKVIVNSNNVNLGDLTLTDTLPKGTHYVTNSIKVTYTEENSEKTKSDINVLSDNKDPETISISLGKVDKKHTITYQIKYNPKDAGEVNKSYKNGTLVYTHKLINKVKFEWNGKVHESSSSHYYDEKPGTGEFYIKKSGRVFYGEDLEKLFEKYNLSSEQKNNLIEWTVTIGEKGQEYKKDSGNFEFSDVLPEGLQYVEGTLRYDNKKAENIKYENNRLSCSIPSPIKGDTKITFLTKINDTKPGTPKTTDKDRFILGDWGTKKNGDKYDANWGSVRYENTADIDGNTSTGYADYDVRKRIQKLGSFDWKTQQYEWTVDLNSCAADHNANRSVYMKNPGVKDILPEGHTLAKNSDGKYEVYVQKFINNKEDGDKMLLSNDKSNWNLSYSDDTRTLEIKWKDTNNKNYITSRYKFYIKTVLTDAKKDEFEKGTSNLTSKNTVYYNAENVTEEGDSNKATAEVTIKHLNVISKSLGNYTSGTSVPWNIIVNQNIADNILAGATVEDQLNEGLLLDTASIHVYEAIRDNNSFKKGPEIKSEAIKCEYDAKTNKLVVKFNEDIPRNKAFIIEFNTIVEDKSITKVSNDAVFKGKYNETYTTQKVTMDVKYDGDIHSEKCSLNVEKHGEDNAMLEGAEFTLENLDYDATKIVTTDSTGYAQFIDYLIPGFRYRLKETKAPKGYYLNDKAVEFIAGSKDDVKVDVQKFNDVIRAVRIKKTSEDSKVLNGAVFEIYKADNSKLDGFTKKTDSTGKEVYYYDGKGKDKLISGADGYVRVKGLDAGSYYFKEIQAPDGYVKSEENYSFTLLEKLPEKAKDSEEYYVDVNYGEGLSSVINKKLKVNFEFKKISDSSDEPLSGAQFKLYKKVCTDSSHNHDKKDDDMNSKCWQYIEEKQSSNDGMIKFANLECGSYRLIETKAPDGYILPDGCWNVEVNADKTISIKAVGAPPAFKNDKKAYELPNFKKGEMPLMGGFGSKLFTYAGLSVILCGLFVMIRKRQLILEKRM